jgi:hypothetical protein
MPDDTPEPNGPNYRGNSYASKTPKAEKAEKVKLVQVTESVAIERKKGLGTKIKETFTGDDMHSVIQYVVLEVGVPAVKTLLSDVVSQGIERLLFGGAAPRGSRRSGYTSYNKMSQSGTTSGRPQMSARARASHDFREIVLPDRGEAEMTLDNLQAQIDEYGMATVEDLYSLVGITGNFQDSQWGWTDMRGSGVKRVREGYLLELPRTTSLD